MLKVYQGNKIEKIDEYFVQVIEGTSGIQVQLCDKTGKRISSTTLLIISKTDGQIHRMSCINNRLGLNLDHKGRLSIKS